MQHYSKIINYFSILHLFYSRLGQMLSYNVRIFAHDPSAGIQVAINDTFYNTY